MTTYPVIQPARPAPGPKSDPTTGALQILAALVGGLAIFLAALLLLLVALNMSFAGEVLPGVSVGGVELAGLTPEAAATRLSERLTFPQTGKIVLQDGANAWQVRPIDLGVGLSSTEAAQAAYLYGRIGNPVVRLYDQVRAWHSGIDLAPYLVYDERLAQLYLNSLAVNIDRPTIEAALSLNGAEVVATPGQIGRQVDIDASLASLKAQMALLSDGAVALVVKETPPEIIDASPYAEQARAILSAPLTLSLPNPQPGDPGPWAILPEQLAAMLKVEKVRSESGVQMQVRLDNEALITYLGSVAGTVNRSPQNARFIFNDETRLLEAIKPSVIGRSIDVDASLAEVHKQVTAGGHAAALTVIEEQPQVADTATGADLGIIQEVSAYTSYFRGSDAERLHNIETAAANFHGLLVPPGAIFSMASVMGDVSLDTGYAEAWIIIGGRTIKGVGGGVCQVSTTLFRTAFFGGFPIIERYPHAYRVGYYEQTVSGHDANMAGLDATVFVPAVDFKFQNDTPYWLLMETYFRPNSRSLTWKFYSTSDGRTVRWETSGPQNIVEPPEPKYEESAELAPGVIRQVDWAAEGADVTVLRTVYRGGIALFTDSVITHYMPWGDVFQYGPGTQLPGQNNPKKPPNINP